MRFRPRYSLLTLLVLTALVAGGVKLWYGPHRVRHEQPFPINPHHENHSTLALVADCYSVYEFEYTRSSSGRRIRYHAARPLPNHFLHRISLQDSMGRDVWGLSPDLESTELSNAEFGPPERITLWVAPPVDGFPSDASDPFQTDGNRGSIPNYIMTDQQRIFRSDHSVVGLRGVATVAIDISEIPFPLVRARIREEFAKQK